jgi:antitoxin component of MazEF toxin-antitoxin module
MASHDKILRANEISMNFIGLKTEIMKDFQLKQSENIIVRLGNVMIHTKISVRNRIWKIPLKKLGFRVGDKISFNRSGSSEIIIKKS